MLANNALKPNPLRGPSSLVAFVLLLLSVGCALGPTEQEIAESLDETLRSVTGDWHGRSTGVDSIALDFKLHEASNGQVTGIGSMKESRTESALPFTVSGSYRRPVLALTLVGLRYEGEPVQGTLRGEYISVGGISATLHLTGPGHSRSVVILLQED